MHSTRDRAHRGHVWRARRGRAIWQPAVAENVQATEQDQTGLSTTPVGRGDPESEVILRVRRETGHRLYAVRRSRCDRSIFPTGPSSHRVFAVMQIPREGTSTTARGLAPSGSVEQMTRREYV